MKHELGMASRVYRVEPRTGERLERLRALAWLLDSSIPLPGGFRIGLDALLGLVPVVGDIAGALFAGFILNEARSLGAPRSVLWRMSANVVIETLVGSIPVLGDLFDAGFKANLRNIALLEQYQLEPQRSRRQSRGFLFAIAAVLLLLVTALAAIPVLIVAGIVSVF